MPGSSDCLDLMNLVGLQHKQDNVLCINLDGCKHSNTGYLKMTDAPFVTDVYSGRMPWGMLESIGQTALRSL